MINNAISATKNPDSSLPKLFPAADVWEQVGSVNLKKDDGSEYCFSLPVQWNESLITEAKNIVSEFAAWLSWKWT